MSSAAAIRAGGAYVEIFARDGAFQQAMSRVQGKMQAVAQTMQRFGTGMSLTGAALGAPLVLAARQAAAFEDAILGMQAAAGLSADQVAALSNEAKRLSAEMGVAPESIANAFLELAKAGMSVEEVLKGAGRSAVEFARISGVDAVRAAVFMKASMNVFGVSAQEAVDTLSAAADSSETSIEAMIESFSQVGSAGEAFDQTLFGISQAMAALAKSNIMGEEAGTAIKTMLTKLVAPTDDAQEALAELGLTVASFRDEAGKLLPMAQVAGVFERALANMGGNAEQFMMAQRALVDVFEQRGIKVITAFANIGEKGFKAIEEQMMAALPVSAKFAIVMSGITGQFERLSSSVKRVSIEFGEAIQGPLTGFTDAIVGIMEAIAKLIDANPELAVTVAAAVAGMVALGTAAIAGALAIKGIGIAVAMILSPIGVLIAQMAVIAYLLSGLEDFELLGMKIQNVWRKIGIYIAAAFDADVFDRMDELLAKADADFAKWAAKSQEKKQPAGNAAKPDVNRKPMADNPMARRKAAEELAKEDAEYEQTVQQAIAKTTDAFFRATKGFEKFGQAGREAFDEYLNGLARLQQQVDAGILNPTSLEQEAEKLQEIFSGRIDLLGNTSSNANGVSSAGTFGSTDGLGIGPELNPIAEATQRTADNTGEAAAALRELADQGKALAGGDPGRAAAMLGDMAAAADRMRQDAAGSALDLAAAGKAPMSAADVTALGELESKISALRAYLEAAPPAAGPGPAQAAGSPPLNTSSMISPMPLDAAQPLLAGMRELAASFRELIGQQRATIGGPQSPAADQATGGTSAVGAAIASSRIAAASDQASSGAAVASQVGRLQPVMSGGFASVVEACKSTTEAVQSNSKLLDRMLTKMDGLKAVYV